MTLLNVGDTAPTFTLPNADGENITLSDTNGQWRVLYFYPKASTPGCTTQACAIRDNMSELTKRNTIIFGLSPDPQKKLKKFEEDENLSFPLLGNESKETLEAYGVWQEKSMYGRKYMGVARTTYIIDPEGIIQHIMPKVKPTTHLDDVLKWLDENATTTT